MPDGSRRAADHEPRGHPQTGRRRTWACPPAPTPSPARPEELAAGAEVGRLSQLRQAGHVLVGQRAILRREAPMKSPTPGPTPRTGGRVAGARVIVEGRIDFDFEITLLTVRSRDADGVGRHGLLRAHRPPPGQRRLCRELAAAGHERPLRWPPPRTSPAKVTEALGGLRRLRRRTVRQGRPGLVLRGLAPPARHRSGHPGQPDDERVCTSRPRHLGSARRRDPARARRQRRHLRRH